jgi:hypothetical protein
MNLTPEEQKLLLEVAALWTPDMLNGLYHAVCWFSPEEDVKIRQANELAIKLGINQTS